MVKTAFLRVYQPLSTFSAREREAWGSITADNPSVEARVSRAWLVARSLPENDSSGEAVEGAFVRRVGEDVYVCPWRTRLRMLVGLLAFRGSLPEEVADAFVPEREARRAARELASLDPEIRSHILHANWHVPLRWFVAFEADERILTEDVDGLRIRYETTLDKARSRLRRALEILEGSWADESMADAVRELGDWVIDFPSEGLLELDYGSVAGIFDADELVEDRSADDVWQCLEALATGDFERAGRLFGALTDRWAGVRAHEVMN